MGIFLYRLKSERHAELDSASHSDTFLAEIEMSH